MNTDVAIRITFIGFSEAAGAFVEGWHQTGYNLERMTRHGIRRAAEMREVASTVAELGIANAMVNATVG